MLKLHCFSQSGNAYKVAFALNAMGLAWQPVFVDFMHGATRDPDWREHNNLMGEVPILEDGDLQLTQSGVILTYLAEQYGQFGGSTAHDRREILRWILFDNHKFTSYFATYRFIKSFSNKQPDPTIMQWLLSRIDSAYDIVNRHLAGSTFMIGEQLTIADFSLCGYLFYPIEESGYEIASRFPHIAAWRERLRAVPGWADPYQMMPGERILPKW
jgi:glutathione S-transferase